MLARVKWSVQPINPYSLGFRSGVGTIDAIATLVNRAAPITTLRSGYKARAATIFLDLEKAFELVLKEVLLESAALLGIRGRLLLWLDDYLTNRTETVHFQGKASKVNHMSNGTPQGSSLSPLLFNMVINRLLQLDLGSKVQMIAYADDLAIHGGPIGQDTVYEQMTTALKKIEAKAMQLGLNSPPRNVRHYGIEVSTQIGFQDRRSKDPMAGISQIPRGHHRQKTKLQETSRLRKTKY